jgi:hypothetical protein
LLHNVAVSIAEMRCFAPRLKSGSKGFWQYQVCKGFGANGHVIKECEDQQRN